MKKYDIYVSPKGRDYRSGSKESPVQTIQEAITRASRPLGIFRRILNWFKHLFGFNTNKRIYLSPGEYTTSCLQIPPSVDIYGAGRDFVTIKNKDDKETKYYA